jgi:hypothetical protein
MRHILILAAALALGGCNGSVDSASFVEGVDGLRCSADVLHVSDTGEAIDGDPVAELTLLVAAPAARPFETTIEATVPRLAVPRKGDTLAVSCDPANPDRTELIL